MRLVIPVVLAALAAPASAQWTSAIVYPNAKGDLEYVSDAEGNRVPDFSYAGYGNGIDLPDVPVVLTIQPVAGDNTAHVQAAIDAVGGLPLGSDGFRGALLLEAGLYEIAGIVYVNESGIVLRGEGDGDDPAVDTILFATGNTPTERDVLVVGGGINDRWEGMQQGSETNIVTDVVEVGDQTFEVADASSINPGDTIIITHPCTEAWLQAVDYGGTASDPGWEVDELPIVFNRTVKVVNGNTITIDAPVFTRLDRALSQSRIHVYGRVGLVTNVGVENLRVDIEAASDTDENHAKNAISFIQVEDAWARDCTLRHFIYAGIVTKTATRITVERCNAIEPASLVEGSRRYNFSTDIASQQILFRDNHASDARHAYVSNETTWTSGIAFVDNTASGSYAASGGHRRWSMGLLFDNHRELDGPRLDPRLITLENEGSFGTSHGWAAAHSVIWNSDFANGYAVIQKPPTAQNYAIGVSGSLVTGASPPAPFAHSEGYIEGTGTVGLVPRSLYYGQRDDRLNIPVGTVPETVSATSVQVTPNPATGPVTFRFALAEPQPVRLTVYDLLGRELAVLTDGQHQAGSHAVAWPGAISSGVYVYRLSMSRDTQAGTFAVVR